MANLKDHFIILKTLKYSESDLILHALNRQGAKLGFIAKGALRSKKRFSGGVLEASHFVYFNYRMKPSKVDTQELYFLQEANLINGFEGIRQDFDRLQAAMSILKSIDRLSVQGSMDAEELFNLLGNALKMLETTQHAQLLKVHFDVKLLYQQGVLPQDLVIKEFLVNPLKNHLIAGEQLGYPNSEAYKNIFDRVEVALKRYLQEAGLH